MARGRDGTIWSALSGRALEGPQKGKTLTRIPSLVTDWGYWLLLHPESTAYDLYDGRRYPQAKLTVGHRDVNSTSCPGDEIYNFLKSEGFKAAVTAGETGSLPGPSPKPWQFWAWANWKRSKPPRGPRPVPMAWVTKNSTWCWRALSAWNKAHP